MDYKTILENEGFYMYHACSCRGTREERFRLRVDNRPKHLRADFYILPKAGKMETRLNKRIVARTGIENLQSEINKYK